MRIQIELPPGRVTRLKNLMEELDIHNYKDLFINALSVFEWSVEETRNGRVITSIHQKDGGQSVLVVPSLQNLRRPKP